MNPDLFSAAGVDLQGFYKQHYTQANLIVGLEGGYPAGFVARVRGDFAALPAGTPDRVDFPPPAVIGHNQVTPIQKDTRSVAWSLGFPIDVKRGDPDFPALLVMQSWLGQHRSDCELFHRIREVRGLDYGDYAYIEYFPRGMFRFEPEPNLARHQQIFQIWIRPVEVPTATFSLRLALFELDKMVKNGHLRAENLRIVGVAKDTGKLAAELTGDAPTPIAYNSPKPQEVMDEDKIVASWPLLAARGREGRSCRVCFRELAIRRSAGSRSFSSDCRAGRRESGPVPRSNASRPPPERPLEWRANPAPRCPLP